MDTGKSHGVAAWLARKKAKEAGQLRALAGWWLVIACLSGGVAAMAACGVVVGLFQSAGPLLLSGLAGLLGMLVFALLCLTLARLCEAVATIEEQRPEGSSAQEEPAGPEHTDGAVSALG